VRHIFKPISYLEIQLLSGVSGGYIKWSRVTLIPEFRRKEIASGHNAPGNEEFWRTSNKKAAERSAAF
ncbi:hypothetical protein V6266_22590, partial [Enterobacter asburiae]|uniref:hypothetical protein n=1 Tax=Enterobacter asburiae TaxID=61645 RepID=UPI003B83F6AC